MAACETRLTLCRIYAVNVSRVRPTRRSPRLAGEQHGVVARRQLRALGLSLDAIDHRVASGRLHPLHRGVYAVGHRALTLRGRFRAAVLACGETAVLSHFAAAVFCDAQTATAGPIDCAR
jgi:hypothetical protein